MNQALVKDYVSPSSSIYSGASLQVMSILYLIDTSSPMNQALVKDYVESFKQYLQRRLTSGDVYLVFDRYIKSYESSPSQRLC